MNMTALRVGLALFWLVMGVGLLTRAWWGGPDLDARAGERNLNLFGAAAVALAAWNLLRLAGERRRRRRDSISLAEEIAALRRPTPPTDREPNPAFDFTDRVEDKPD